jgi:hypothetical protein
LIWRCTGALLLELDARPGNDIKHVSLLRLVLPLTSNMFRASSVFRDCRITFFTRSPCGLCDTAKAVVQNVRTKRPFEYEEINVMETGQEKWRDAYEFDTPVVSPKKYIRRAST